MSEFKLTPTLVSRVIATVDAGLSRGLGNPVPGQMCVEAAVCYALGMKHSDEPTCVNSVIRSFKIRLNDSSWSSNDARAKGMRRLAVLQLGTKEGFDEVHFSKLLTLRTIQILLPRVLSLAGLHAHAKACENVTTLEDARAAAEAAHAAAAAARVSEAARAAAAAAYAADAAAAAAAYTAADAAARDEILTLSAKIAEDILIEMDVPAVAFLSMLETRP